MIDALAPKLEHGGLQLFCVSSIDSESWYNRSTHPRNRVRRHLQYRRLHSRRRHPADSSLEPFSGDWSDRLQFRRLSRHGPGAPPALFVHVVCDDGWSVRDWSVSRRLLRRGLLLSESHSICSESFGFVLPRSVPGATSGSLPRASTTSAALPTNRFRRCSTTKAFHTACMSGGTGRSTTGRTGFRWPPRTYHESTGRRLQASGIARYDSD